MIRNADPSVCTDDGCSTQVTTVREPAPPRTTHLKLDIVSDTICPWCYVGKRRIDCAIEELAAEGLTITTRWLPFELNPKMPTGGMNRREYRSGKFGSWEHSQRLDAQVAAEGAREGISFRHDLMERAPNTRASHRLIWLAGEVNGLGAQNRLVEELFSAYFCQGRDVGDRKVLTDIGVQSGLPAERVMTLLDGDEGTAQVLQHETWAASAGIQGVPSIIAGNLLLFSGAQRTPLIVKALREVAMAQTSAEIVDAGEADARA